MEELILKYLKGEATENEMLEIEAWVKESPENRKDFAKKVNLYALAVNVNGKADMSDLGRIISTIRRIDKRRGAVRYFAAAVMASALIVGAGLYSSYKIGTYKSEVAYILEQSNTTLEYSTPYGVKSRITLPDNSVVWLNSGSRISFPSKFTGNERLISFSGEGFFKVEKDSLRPMKIVTPGDVTVNVLGTKFNLYTYAEDRSMSLLLLSGRVNIQMKNGSVIENIKPSEKIIIDKIENSTRINPVKDTMPTTGWRDGWLIFDDLTLSDVFVKMKRWYGISIKVEDNSILYKRLSAKFREESASQVMDLMHKTQLINYTIQDSIAYVKNYSW
ncbi:MAG: FecR domain-containing protein [Bacteroidales bacterium]|jgi:ferric-dicitrate binding protein FerR (iron transport regulator)